MITGISVCYYLLPNILMEMKSTYLKHHLAKCDLSFLQVVKSEIVELKNQIEAEDAILRNVVPEEWSDEIAELENYFRSIKLPTEPFKLDNGSTIYNCQIFIDSHLAIVKANNGERTFLSYLNRLRELKEVIDCS